MDADGNTPLFFALENNLIEPRVRILLENGANVNFKTDKNVTPMAKVSLKTCFTF